MRNLFIFFAVSLFTLTSCEKQDNIEDSFPMETGGKADLAFIAYKHLDATTVVLDSTTGVSILDDAEADILHTYSVMGPDGAPFEIVVKRALITSGTADSDDFVVNMDVNYQVLPTGELHIVQNFEDGTSVDTIVPAGKFTIQ